MRRVVHGFSLNLFSFLDIECIGACLSIVDLNIDVIFNRSSLTFFDRTTLYYMLTIYYRDLLESLRE